MAHDPGSVSVDAQAAGFGMIAGMRTQLPLALLALAASRGRFADGSEAPLSLLRSPVVARVLALSAAGELIVDKLPFTPSRLDPGPLFGRLLIGGVAGAAITAEARDSAVLGAALGAAGAFVGAQSGYHARAWLGRATDVPDPVWGAVEDATAIALGLLLLREHSSSWL
ncbi:MAG: DUF4126 family protein [Thermomicrobiales bacterium]